jgi:hypothetical protein
LVNGTPRPDGHSCRTYSKTTAAARRKSAGKHELRNAGLIRCEKVGQTVYCTPDLEALEEIERFLAQVTS